HQYFAVRDKIGAARELQVDRVALDFAVVLAEGHCHAEGRVAHLKVVGHGSSLSGAVGRSVMRRLGGGDYTGSSVLVRLSVTAIGMPSQSRGYGAGAPVAFVAVRELRSCAKLRRVMNSTSGTTPAGNFSISWAIKSSVSPLPFSSVRSRIRPMQWRLPTCSPG